MCDPTKLDDLLAAGSALTPADRRALLYPLAAASPTLHLWLRWVTLFTPIFVPALLLTLGGMLATLAGASPTLSVLLVQSGTALLAVLAIKTGRIGWQALLVTAAAQLG